MKLRDCNAILRHSGIKTKWLWLHIHVLFLLECAIILANILYLVILSPPLSTLTAPQMNYYVLNNLVLGASLIFTLFVYIGLRVI